MRKASILFFSILLTLSLTASSNVKGYLFIIGGGDRPEGMMKKFVELAGMFQSGKIIVFPMASSVPKETGPAQIAELKKVGAKKVEYRVLTRAQALKPENAKILDDAGGVFFPGGVQSRLVNILFGTPLHKKLLQMYEEGCVIGGTSAGAAVMSEVMITGDEKRKTEEGHDFETIEAANVVTSPGLGFIKMVIVDQHFATRKRHNRLISLVADNPQLLGLGIDESTAVIVRPNQTFEIIGQKNVIVYDASQAKIKILPSRQVSFSKMIMHVLISGDKFDLRAREVVE